VTSLGIGDGQLVLDLGCGTGAFLRAAADRGAQVAGLDAAEGLLAIARDAGLTPLESFYSWAYEFAGEESMLRAMLSAGSAVAAAEHAGRDILVEAILGALAPYREADGSYRTRCDTR
jgi:SAM-dependent methyltransferase